MLKWLLGTLLGVLLGILAYFSWHLGAFKPVNLVEKQVGPLQLIYKSHVGPYHKIVSTLDEVEKWAKENHVPCAQTFGEFLDNPNTVEEGRLRANCGCVVSFDAQTSPLTLPENFSSKIIPMKNYLTVEFEGSPGIGPIRVYPKATDYFAAKNKVISGPVIEVYKVLSETAMITTYLFPMD